MKSIHAVVCGWMAVAALSGFGFPSRVLTEYLTEEEPVECKGIEPVRVVRFFEDAAWVENVRTNQTIGTTGSFGENTFEPFLRAALLKPYAKEIADGTEFGRTVDALVREFVHAYYIDAYGYGSVSWKIRQEAKKAKEKFGESDPLLRLLSVEFRGDVAKKLFQELDDETKADPDRLALRFVASIVSCKINSGRDKETLQRSFELFADWIERDRFDARVGFWLFSMQLDNAMNQPFADFLAGHPMIDPWLSLIARIRSEDTAAWKSRGSGYANEVTDSGWDGWNDHSRKLKEHLAEARRLHPDWPEPGIYAANTLFPTSDDAESDEFYRWFTSGRLDMFLVQSNYLFYKLYPRWCGSRRDMEQFAEACYATGRHDTLLPFWYAVTHFAISMEYEMPQEEYFKNNEIARKCEEVLLNVIRNEANRNRREWCLSQDLVSVLYYLRGEYEKIPGTCRTVEKDRCFGQPWKYIYNLAQMMQNIRTCAEKNHELLIPMHRSFEEEKYQEFLDAVAAAGTVSYTKHERDYIRDCTLIAKAKLGQPFDWVEADMKSPFSDFINYGGAWVFDKGTYYRPEWGSRTGALNWNPRFPADSEFEFEVSDLGNGKESTLICYFGPEKYRGYMAPYFALCRKDGKIGVQLTRGKTDAYDGVGSVTWIGEAKEKTKVLFRFANGELSVLLDGANEPALTDSSMKRRYADFKDSKFIFETRGRNVRLYSLRGRPLAGR